MQMGNKGAFIRFEAPDLKPNIVTFSAVVSSSCFKWLLFSLVSLSNFCSPDVRNMLLSLSLYLIFVDREG